MPNRLVGETNPCLQQHANNPVEWYPWEEQALALALDQDKPVLLSIGYSPCHRCHVMAHECFKDPGVAALMNRWFINIKVDREERPDLDFCLRRALVEGQSEARDMALTSLCTMGRGGIHGHPGGGFFRYSVEQDWLIPHFEKMLYDNGPLLSL